jgi:hypothetical protein
MKAETTRRLLSPAWARRCAWRGRGSAAKVAFISLPTAALMPLWASEMTSLTPAGRAV